MANIRIVTTTPPNTSIEEVAVINASAVVFPEESLWVKTDSGELTLVGHVPGRAGSWISRIDTSAVDAPPIIEWEGSGNDATIKAGNTHSRATLRVSHIDLQPKPHSVYPDIFWVSNGQDLVPRSQ